MQFSPSVKGYHVEQYYLLYHFECISNIPLKLLKTSQVCLILICHRERQKGQHSVQFLINHLRTTRCCYTSVLWRGMSSMSSHTEAAHAPSKKWSQLLYRTKRFYPNPESPIKCECIYFTNFNIEFYTMLAFLSFPVADLNETC